MNNANRVFRFWWLAIALVATFIWTHLAAATLPENELMDRRWILGQFKGFNLGGVTTTRIQNADFVGLKSYGVSLIRISFTARKSTGDKEYKVSELEQAHLNEIVNQAKSMEISVVIALEIDPAGHAADYWSDEKVKTNIGEIWRSVAVQYKGNPAIVGFDLLNEPVVPKNLSTSGRDVWREWALAWAYSIREVDPGRTLVFEPTPWALPENFYNLKPLPLKNVVYSFHLYAPHEITHQGIQNYPLGVSYPGHVWALGPRWDRARLNETTRYIREFSRRFKVPIYVGEFSCIRYAPGDSRYRYIEDALSIIENAAWSWTYHSYKEWDGWDPEIDSSDPQDVLPRSGGKIMNLLIRHILAAAQKQGAVQSGFKK